MPWPEKVDVRPEVFLADLASSKAISRSVRAGRARKLGPKLYTRNLADQPEATVSRNLWPIVGVLDRNFLKAGRFCNVGLHPEIVAAMREARHSQLPRFKDVDAVIRT